MKHERDEDQPLAHSLSQTSVIYTAASQIRKKKKGNGLAVVFLLMELVICIEDNQRRY